MFVFECPAQHEQFGAKGKFPLIDSRRWRPAFQPHRILVARLRVQLLQFAVASSLPWTVYCIDDDVLAIATGKLPELHEQQTAVARIRRMTESFWIEQIRAGRPVAVFVREHPVNHQNFLAIGVIVRMKMRVRLVLPDRSDLTGLRWTT